jgi:hypothetical protein
VHINRTKSVHVNRTRTHHQQYSTHRISLVRFTIAASSVSIVLGLLRCGLGSLHAARATSGCRRSTARVSRCATSMITSLQQISWHRGRVERRSQIPIRRQFWFWMQHHVDFCLCLWHACGTCQLPALPGTSTAVYSRIWTRRYTSRHPHPTSAPHITYPLHN